MYDTILLPIETNPGAERAVALAVDFAERYGAELQICYVAEDAEGMLAHVPTGERRDELPAGEKEAIGTVEAAAREAGVSVQTYVGVGEPERSIPQHRERVGADFVVMGTHGRTGIDRLLTGSVAEKTVRQADVPVLVVPLDGAAKA